MTRPAAWFVYILRCGDGSLYTGIALDVRARFDQHVAGKGARYTRGRGPLELRSKARCGTLGDALRVERAVKRLPRAVKEGLASRPRALSAFVRRCRAGAGGPELGG